MKCFFLTYIALFLCALQVNGQRNIVEKYADEQGLNHSIVYRVFQDSKGFIWAATDNGLNRFDGNEFTSLNKQSALISDYLFGMQEMNSKLLFTSYNNGIIEYSLKEKIFKRSKVFSAVKKPIDIYVHNKTVLIIDNVGYLWIYSENKLLGKIYDVSNVEIRNNTIYFCNGTSGFKELVVSKEKFVQRSIFYQPNSSVVQTIPLSNGNWLVIETESLFEYDPVHKKTIRINKQGSRDLRFVGYKPGFKDSNNDIWLGTADGTIYQYQAEKRQLKIVFENTVVNQFFEDSNKNLWIATYGFGLWKIPPFRTKEYPFNGHLSTELGVVSRNQTNYFVGYRQLYLPGETHQILNDIELFRKQFRTNNNEGIVYADDKQFFYCQKYRLFYNNWKGKTIELTFDKNLQSILISQILPFENNKFIIATRNAAYYYDAAQNKVQKIEKLGSSIVYSVNYHKQQFVFCTDKGVFVGPINRLAKINLSASNKTESIRSAALLSNKYLIVASNKRVFEYDLSTEKITELYTDVYCSKIIKAYGFTWVLCNKGLIRISNKRNVRLISSEYGVPGWAKSMQVKDNKFFILYQDKILEISASKLLNLSGKEKYELYADYANFEGKDHFVIPKTIVLHEPLRKMVIKFTIPNYLDVKTARYLVKINEDVELEGSRSGKFNILSLPNGENTLRFYALDEDDNLLAEKVYYIYNPYPFWRHPMMQLAYVLIVILLSWFIFSRRIKKLNQRKALELETNRLVYELKQKSLLNMLNPHFLNNAINSIQAFVVMNDQRKTLKYLSQFARLMRLNLELMNSSMVPLSKEVDSIRFYVDFEQVRTSGTFDFEVRTSVFSELSDYLVPSFIIQPFVENAIWHGILTTEDKRGKIVLSIEERLNDLLIIVDDDGIGIARSMQMKSDNSLKISLGTKIIKERFEILRSGDKRFEIVIIDKSDFDESGTQVVITVPKTFQPKTNE